MKTVIQSIAIGALFIACTSTTEAQNFELGFRYEPEFSVLMNKNDADAGPALTTTSHFTYINFGIGGVYNFTNHIGLAVDVLWSREGQAFSGNFNGTPPDKNTYSSVVSTQLFLNNEVIVGDYVALSELNFIKFPIMLSLTTDNTQPIFFTLQAGPQINLLYDVAQEINRTDHDYPNSSITPNNLYKSVTIDGIAALGLGFNLTPHCVFTARLRFDYGFADIENKDLMVSYYGAPQVRFYSSDRQSTHNATAGLQIGLDFEL